MSFALVGPAATRSGDAPRYLDQLCQVDAGIAQAQALIQPLLAMVRERRGDALAQIVGPQKLAQAMGVGEMTRTEGRTGS